MRKLTLKYHQLAIGVIGALLLALLIFYLIGRSRIARIASTSAQVGRFDNFVAGVYFGVAKLTKVVGGSDITQAIEEKAEELVDGRVGLVIDLENIDSVTKELMLNGISRDGLEYGESPVVFSANDNSWVIYVMEENIGAALQFYKRKYNVRIVEVRK